EPPHASARVALRASLVDALLELLADDSPLDRDPDLREQRLCHGPSGNRHRGLARARPLEGVARVGEPVLHRPGEVGVAWARKRYRLRPRPFSLAFRRPPAHAPRPVLL